MFISHKSNVIQTVHEVEWQCRRKAKGLDKSAYWTWLATVTSEDENGHKTYDYSGEDYEIVETDVPLSYETKDDEGEDVTISFNQSGHIHSDLDGTHYHLKWDGSKIIPDDDALAACQLTEEWKRIRTERTRLLAECDYYGNSDVTMPAAWKTYRKKLRDLPADQSDKTKYTDITWPTKPA
jgi:hypothetical protein